jgi:mannose-6-phosphate isomerase-like protein (cupin superfamily)
MFIRRLAEAQAFVTKDGSSIRPILDLSCAPVSRQSLAEAALDPGRSTTRHRHPGTEEFYFLTQGRAWMEVDGEVRLLAEGDACLIPAGATHQLHNPGPGPVRLLCCCAPPYSDQDTELLPDGPVVDRKNL